MFSYLLWDNGDLIDGGRRLYNVGVRAIAKFNEDPNPHEFVSEFICHNLGRLMGLPVVLGVTSKRDGELCYCSFNFNEAAPEQLPPANAARLVERRPELATGILLFDSWIVNEDRHPRNISYFEDTGNVALFDHGAAILKGDDPFHRLENYANDPAFGESCVAKEIRSLVSLWQWWEVATAIPEAAIRGCFSEAVRLGLPDEWADECTQYLIERRKILVFLIEQNTHRLEKLAEVPTLDFDAGFDDAYLRTASDEYGFIAREAEGWLR